jgi:hypothetical protein
MIYLEVLFLRFSKIHISKILASYIQRKFKSDCVEFNTSLKYKTNRNRLFFLYLTH